MKQRDQEAPPKSHRKLPHTSQCHFLSEATVDSSKMIFTIPKKGDYALSLLFQFTYL